MNKFTEKRKKQEMYQRLGIRGPLPNTTGINLIKNVVPRDYFMMTQVEYHGRPS